MALPQINDIPKYGITIPSSGVHTQYRPYLVREEKVLLIALESTDQKQILNATINLITSCLDDGVDVKKLTTYDIEYIFTQIRSKSVGESISINVICQEDDCEELTELQVALDDIKVEVFDNKTRTISLTDNISLEMMHLPYTEAINNPKIIDPDSFAEQMFHTIVSCIDAVCTQDERVSTADSTREEVEAFVESLTSNQFADLRAFVENTPTITKLIEFKCSKCEADNKYQLTGLQDFFG
tara:strand:- start:1871 stop:2593 length:723 start_codon:yes stop_codon:yes gene_type:complete